MSRFFVTTLAVSALCIFMMALEKTVAADTHLVPGQHASIQSAINASTTGDQIEVAQGTYYEAINFNGKAVRLYSNGGATVTTINGGNAYHVVQCISGEDANTILEGFTITGGNASGSNPDDRGSGMLNNNSSPTVKNCIFNSNFAAYGGGGMGNENHSSPRVTNCIFNSNNAFSGGGGMGNENNSNPIVTNCTFTSNYAPYGGGMANVSSSPVVISCIFWSDNVEEIYNDNSNPSYTYCDIRMTEGTYPGIGNINIYPSFSQGPQRLLFNSPCIDAGSNASVPAGITTDLEGNPRILDGNIDGIAIVDMGAYEFVPIHNVTKDKLYITIQAAINDSNNGDQIEVAPGTYYEAINFNGKAVRLYSKSGPDYTTINANGASHVVQCKSGENANTILEGFTITGGAAQGASSPDCDGGGMFNDHSSPTVKNCIFTYNSADYGGGMYNGYGSNPVVINCTFYINIADYWGAGIFNKESNPVVTGCDFENNSASWSGGGMFNENCSPAVTGCNFSYNRADKYLGGGMYSKGNSSPTVTNCVFNYNNAGFYSDTWPEGYGGGMCNEYYANTVLTNCTFSYNSAKVWGGAMYNKQCTPSITNCKFSNNLVNTASAVGGGGIFNETSSPTLINCLFSYNSTNQYGGGIYNKINSNPSLTNCTLSHNTATSSGGGMHSQETSTPIVTNSIFWNDSLNEINGASNITHSIIYGIDWDGDGLLDPDPCFNDADAGDFRLRPDSPCIDAGSNLSVPASVLKDLAGKLRFADDPNTSDTGHAGTNGRPVVDIGAYEFQGCGFVSQNLLANPGFETGSAAGWITNWGWSLKADANQHNSGSYSGLVSGRTAAWQGAWQSVQGLMDSGKTYRISGSVLLQNADSNHIALVVKKTDATGTHYYGIDNATGYRNQWIYLDGIMAIDIVEPVTELFVYFEGPAPSVNFYVDDVVVTEVMGDMNHNGSVNFLDYSLFAPYYGFNCLTQDCGRANLCDCDNVIDVFDLAVFTNHWLEGL